MNNFASTAASATSRALVSVAARANSKLMSADGFVKNRPVTLQLASFGIVFAVIGTVAAVNATAPVVAKAANKVGSTSRSAFDRVASTVKRAPKVETASTTTIDGELDELMPDFV